MIINIQRIIKLGIFTLLLVLLALMVHWYQLFAHREDAFKMAIVLPRLELNAHHSRNYYVLSIYQQVVEPLLKLNDDLELESILLAQLPRLSQDERSYYFELKPNIAFHNGSQMTSLDVQFAFERLFWPEDPSIAASSYEGILGAKAMLSGESDHLIGFEVIDELRFVIHLEEPFPSFLWRLTLPYVGIYSMRSYRDAPYQWAISSLVGSGPYLFQSYLPTKKLILERFEQYHGVLPAVQVLEFIVKRDPHAAVEAYMQGDVDMSALPFEYYEEIKAKNRLNEVLTKERWSTLLLTFNLNDPLLRNVYIRRAIAHAVDRQEINQRVYSNLAEPTYNYLPIDILGGQDNLIAPEQNLEAARAALMAGGYPNGVNIVVHHTSDSNKEAVLHALARQLARVGVNLILIEVSDNEWVHLFSNDMLTLNFARFSTSIPDADDLLYSIAHSQANMGWSLNYHNDYVNNLLEQARITSDVMLRTSIYHQVEQYFVGQDVAILPLIRAPELYLLNPKYHYEPSPSGILRFSKLKTQD